MKQMARISAIAVAILVASTWLTVFRRSSTFSMVSPRESRFHRSCAPSIFRRTITAANAPFPWRHRPGFVRWS